MVGYPRDVEEDSRRQLMASSGASLSGCCIPPSTATDQQPIARACELAQKRAERGAAALDAPVSGGDVGAKTRHCRSWSAAT